MRIGAVGAASSIPSTYGMSAVRTKHVQRTQSADIVGKKLQNEITGKQQQKNGISSNLAMPAQEKTTKNMELSQGISSLKAQLRRHQIESSSDEKKNIPDDNTTSAFKEEIAKEAEAKAAKAEERKEELKKAEEAKAAKEERMADESKSAEEKKQEVQSLLASDSAKNQVSERNAVIAKTEAGIVIKKGEMRQDEIRGEDTKKAQEDIKTQEKRARILSNITLGPKGVNNADGGMKATNYSLHPQNQNILHEGNDGIVFFKAG